jgi:squalene-hopene/tetraprenyl-beta-curcumene cyclase
VNIECLGYTRFMKLALVRTFTIFAATVAAQQVPPTGGPDSWDPAAAAAYLDARMDSWFANATQLRTGDTKTACVSCHAGLAYALSRPALRRLMHVDAFSTQEARLIDETTRRVETYGSHQVLYDSNERRQIESRGTEAVLNAVILTSADAARNLHEASAPTKKALARLWETQRADGRWDWLEFGLEPWETTEAAYHGATFAAFAVGTAPTQHDEVAAAGIERLRAYLSANYQTQHLYNRTWALLASTRLKRVVTDAQRDALIDELVRAQRDDGGWSLETMGPWKWSKNAPPVKSPGDVDTSLLAQSDGYATGLVVYTLKQAGVGARDAIGKGIRWLATNQRAVPVPGVPGRAWRAHSLNYDREHGGEKGEPWRRLFMSDTATAFAILALEDSEQGSASEAR